MDSSTIDHGSGWIHGARHTGGSAGRPVRGPGAAMAAAALALLAALLLAPGGGRAADECGALSSGAASCMNQAFASGISYSVASGAGALGLTVGGGAATTITASGASHGVSLSMGVTTTGNMALTVGSAGAVEIVEDSTASHGIHLRQDGSGTATADIRSGVTIGTASAPMGTDGVRFDLFRNTANKGGDTASLTSGAEIHAAGRGLVLFRAWDAQTNAATTLTNTGAVSAGVGNAASTALGNTRPHGILLNIAPPTDAGFNGDATLTNSGPVTVSGGYDGIRMNYNAHGDAVVDNQAGGDVTATAAGGRGIVLLHSTGDGAATIRNAATINAAGDSAENNGAAQGAIVLRRNGGTIAGVALLDNRGDVTATAASAIYVYSLHGVIRVTNRGDLSGEGSLGRGIRAWTEGNGGVTVTSTGGEIASASAQGIHVRSDGAGAVRISSASDISARTGVLAEVTRASAMGETRAAEDQPLIGVTWTGTFARDAAKTAADDRGRFAAATAADMLSFDQESAAGKALEGSLRYGGAAGIEAHALSWRDVVTAVAKGDDPGTIADATAQMNLLSTTHADSRRAAILARFRAALRNADLAVAAAVLTDVDSTATSVSDLSDAEIVDYLDDDDAATRALLRNVLAQGLSDKEKAVLRAVATNTGLDTALDDADAGFDNAYKTAVRALLDRYNVGNIRVYMNEGSIDSRGDGIRAYYATPHDMNGAIDVTVAEGVRVTGGKAGVYAANGGSIEVTVAAGASVTGGTAGIYAANAGVGGIHVSVDEGAEVTGGEAGIYVANAGLGDLAMDSEWRTSLALEEDADVTGLRQQFVTVHGTVTGGTDAAVHLAGGGMLHVGPTGKVHAGSSGNGVLVNASGGGGGVHIHIQGEVRGAEGGDAAVRLTGGGSVRVAETGKVLANGADRAIRTDDPPGDDTPMAKVTLVVGVTPEVEDKVSREDVQSLLDRVQGSIGAGSAADGAPGNVVVALGDDSGGTIENAIDPTNGRIALDPCDFPSPPGQVRGDDDECAPSPMPAPEGGVPGDEDACPAGQVRGDDGECAPSPMPAPEGGVPGDEDACPAGQVRGDDGECAPSPMPAPEGGAPGDEDACPAGQVRGDDGECAPSPMPGTEGGVPGDEDACPAGQVRGDDGECAPSPMPAPEGGVPGDEDACPAGQVRGDDGMCRTPAPGPRLAFDCRDAAGTGICRHNVGADDIRVDVTEGSIDVPHWGVRASYATSNDGNGVIEISVAEGVEVTGGLAGIYVEGAGLGDLARDSVWARRLNLDNDADVTGLRQQFVTVHGTVRGGTDAAIHLVGGGMLHVGPTGKVLAGASGNGVRVNDPGVAHVLVQGEVQGAEGGDAAVRLTGGGSVRVSETGKVLANGAAAAIRADDPDGDGAQAAAKVILVVDRPEDVQSLPERVKGPITIEKDDGSRGQPVIAVGGAGRDLELDNVLNEDGALRSDLANLLEERMVFGFDCDAARDDRCRLYEALPSVLLSMNGLPTYEERMSAARDAGGAWARVEVADGKWKADESTRPNVAYDHRRHGLRMGTDFAVGAAGRFGVSLHGLRGSAEMAQVGEVELSGYGLGVHATTAFADGFHVDAQAAVTWYEADLESAHAAQGALKKGVDGRGHALGMEVGRRTALRDGVSVTPRAGLAWSKAGLNDFAEDGDRGAARVSVKDARSLKGRVGVGAEKALGDAMDGARLFGSLDMEQEFREETEARVSGMSPGSSVTPLKAKAEGVAFRLAVGGARVWGEGRYSLHGSVGYTASGSDNHDLGGGLSFSMRF